jgi:hypothetical protein
MFASRSDDDVTRPHPGGRHTASQPTRLTARPLGATAVRVLGASIITVAAVVPLPSYAVATPAADPQHCTYTLTAPRTTEIPGGATGVTATFAAKSCSGTAQPVFTTVCVATPDSPGQCVKNYGWAAAEVVLPTARISGTFTATGRGCFRTVETEVACEPSGPIASSLFG